MSYYFLSSDLFLRCLRGQLGLLRPCGCCVGGRTVVDARKSRLISPERRCRARPWRTASPRRSTAWRDPRCPGLCAKPQHMNRHPRRKSTWNVSSLSITKSRNLFIYHVVLYYSPSILHPTHPQLGHAPQPWLWLPPPSIPLMGSIMCTEDFLALSIFSHVYQPNLLLYYLSSIVSGSRATA